MKKPCFLTGKLTLLVFWLLAATSLLPAQPVEPVLLKDIAPGADSSNAYGFTDVNGTMFFATNPGNGTYTLWRSNGTTAGTIPLKNFKGGPYNARPDHFTNVGGVLYFAANDGQTGQELWKSDGTPEGTVLVKDLAPGSFTEEGVTYPNRSMPAHLTNVNGTLYFTTRGGTLYKSDGTPGGTVPIKAGVQPWRATSLNGLFYYLERDQEGVWLGKSDGTAAGTGTITQVAEDIPTDFPPGASFLEAVDGKLYFDFYYNYSVGQSTYRHNLELWRSDGTAAGTGLVGKLVEGAGQTSFLLSYTFVGNTLYFTYYDTNVTNPDSYVLYKSDLNAFVEPVMTLGSLSAAPNGQPVPYRAYLTDLNGTLYLAANLQADGLELWKSNGTPEGTQLVADLNPGPGGSNPSFLAAANGVLYFSANDGTHGQEPFRYDPRPATLRINAGSSQPFVTADGRRFLADEYFTGGQPSAVLDNPLDGTEDDSLYLQGRYGSNFGYNLPTGNGTFNVILHFRETYWNMQEGVPGDANSRRFNVDVEGTRRLTEYSILGATFGQNTFVREAFRTTVTDGELNLLFTKGSADLAYVSAIEVVPAAAADGFRINAGGPAYTVSGNRLFLSDQYFKGGSSSLRGLDAGFVYNDEDHPLYWRARFGNSFSYDIPAGNGTYEVTLHFSEPYWGYSAGRGGVGSRKFNVDAEGARKLTEYDIFAEAGGANRAVQEKFTVRVTDGELNLLFTKGSADLAYVSAIEVVPVVNAWRVNAGGPAYTDPEGKAFSADTYFTGGKPTTPVTSEITNTARDTLYHTGRYGEDFSYNVPTGNGEFEVNMFFAETYWGNLVPGGIGSRRFNVDVEGVRQLNDYDITGSTGGAAMFAIFQSYRTTVRDGVLTIRFRKGSADLARVSAIEVVRVPGAARVAAAGTEGTGVRVYPNPVGDRLYVKLSTPAAGVSATSVTTSAGQTVLQNPHRVIGEQELEIKVDGLKSGLYLLRLQDGQGRQVVRFTKQ
jgi:ELWxxDGT repeat protein